MTTGELYDLMGQMKVLISADPEGARDLLSTNPQLTYALMQMLLMLNIYRYEEVQVWFSPKFRPKTYSIQQPFLSSPLLSIRVSSKRRLPWHHHHGVPEVPHSLGLPLWLEASLTDRCRCHRREGCHPRLLGCFRLVECHRRALLG